MRWPHKPTVRRLGDVARAESEAPQPPLPHFFVRPLACSAASPVSRYNRPALTGQKDTGMSLQAAIQQGNLSAVQALLEQGASPLRLDGFAESPLSLACQKGHVEIVKVLIQHGAAVHIAGRETPLHTAAYHGQRACAQALLDAGLPVDAVDERGTTPLSHAAWNGHSALIEDLLSRGAQVDAQNALGWTALMQASLQGHVDVVRLLLDRGAAAERAEQEKGVTPLMLACERGDAELVSLLLSRGARVDTRDRAGKSPLIYAVARACLFSRIQPVDSALQKAKAALQVLESLLAAGADANARNDDSATALMMAVTAGNATVVDRLLQAKADVNACDDCGVTALMLAGLYPRSTIIETLLAASADPNAEARNGNRAFGLAMQFRRPENAVLLRKGGAQMIPPRPPICDPSDCILCRALPDDAQANKARGQQLPAASRRLLDMRQAQRSEGGVAYTETDQICPYCRTEYRHSNAFEYGVPPQDDDRLQRRRNR